MEGLVEIPIIGNINICKTTYLEFLYEVLEVSEKRKNNRVKRNDMINIFLSYLLFGLA